MESVLCTISDASTMLVHRVSPNVVFPWEMLLGSECVACGAGLLGAYITKPSRGLLATGLCGESGQRFSEGFLIPYRDVQ